MQKFDCEDFDNLDFWKKGIMFRICLGNFLEFRWILTSILGFEILSLFWQLFLTRMHLRIIANGTSQSVFITILM